MPLAPYDTVRGRGCTTNGWRIDTRRLRPRASARTKSSANTRTIVAPAATLKKYDTNKPRIAELAAVHTDTASIAR